MYVRCVHKIFMSYENVKMRHVLLSLELRSTAHLVNFFVVRA